MAWDGYGNFASRRAMLPVRSWDARASAATRFVERATEIRDLCRDKGKRACPVFGGRDRLERRKRDRIGEGVACLTLAGATGIDVAQIKLGGPVHMRH